MGGGLNRTMGNWNGQEQILKKEGNWSLNGSTGRYTFDAWTMRKKLPNCGGVGNTQGLGLFFVKSTEKLIFFCECWIQLGPAAICSTFWLLFQSFQFFKLGDLQIQER